MKKGLSRIILPLFLVLLFASGVLADFGLMLRSFKNKNNAQKYLNSLIEQNYKAFIQETQIPDKGFWYRVCVGPFATMDEALDQKEILRSDGFSEYILVVERKVEYTVTAEVADNKEDEPVETRPEIHSEKAQAPVKVEPEPEIQTRTPHPAPRTPQGFN